MGQHFTKVEHTFLTDCQVQVSHLDDMLISLASSVDSIHSTVNLLLCELGKITGVKEGYTESPTFDAQNNIQLTKDLLCSIEDSLNHQKMSVMQGISQLKRLVRSKCREQTLASLPAIRNLKINEYLQAVQEKEEQRLLLSSRSQSTEIHETNGHQKTVELGENMEQTIQSLKNDIEKLESEKVVQMEDNKKMNDDLKRLHQEKAELEKKMLDKEGTRLGIVPVQLYYQHGGDHMASVVQDIMSMLNTQEQFGNRKLAFIRCENTTEIQSSIPLLALCINTSRIGTDTKLAIQGLKELKNTALLIFHHKDEHALPSQNSDRVLTDPEFKALGGIFDMAFLSGRGVYHCEKNTEATCSIVTFIEKSLQRGL